jgi:hypothetical protein
MRVDHEIGYIRIPALAAIHPAPENKNLCRPADPDDPDVRALAQYARMVGTGTPLNESMEES